MALYKSIDAATTTETGAAFYIGIDGASEHSVQVTHTGSPTGVVVTLDGSLDGSNYVTLATWDESTENTGDIIYATGKQVNYVRADLTTLSGGSSPTVTVYISSRTVS